MSISTSFYDYFTTYFANNVVFLHSTKLWTARAIKTQNTKTRLTANLMRVKDYGSSNVYVVQKNISVMQNWSKISTLTRFEWLILHHICLVAYCWGEKKPSPGGLEPPTFRLTAERANRLRHGDNRWKWSWIEQNITDFVTETARETIILRISVTIVAFFLRLGSSIFKLVLSWFSSPPLFTEKFSRTCTIHSIIFLGRALFKQWIVSADNFPAEIRCS